MASDRYTDSMLFPKNANRLIETSLALNYGTALGVAQKIAMLMSVEPVIGAALMVIGFVLVVLAAWCSLGWLWQMGWSYVALIGAPIILYLLDQISFFSTLFGLFENQSGVRRVRMSKIRLSILQSADVDELRRIQWAILKKTHGDSAQRLEAQIALNKHICKKGNGTLGRAMSTRAVPVIADFTSMGEQYWSLENDRVMRYTLSGYADLWIKEVPANWSKFNSDLVAALARWQKLRGLVAQCLHGPTRRDLAKKLRTITLLFLYPNGVFEDRQFHKLEARFSSAYVATDRSIANSKSSFRTIADLEADFMPKLEKAEQLSKDFELKRTKRKAVKHNGGKVEESPTETPDSAQGLCVFCLDANAEMVMKQCGHLIFCMHCARRAVAWIKNMTYLKEVSQRQLEQTGVACPICRSTSYMLRQRDYKQPIFKQ